jgi:hypothetical protein
LRVTDPQAAARIVDHEDAFIDLAFELGGIEGMTATDVKRYIRYIAAAASPSSACSRSTAPMPRTHCRGWTRC